MIRIALILAHSVLRTPVPDNIRADVLNDSHAAILSEQAHRRLFVQMDHGKNTTFERSYFFKCMPDAMDRLAFVSYLLAPKDYDGFLKRIAKLPLNLFLSQLVRQPDIQ